MDAKKLQRFARSVIKDNKHLQRKLKSLCKRTDDMATALITAAELLARHEAVQRINWDFDHEPDIAF